MCLLFVGGLMNLVWIGGLSIFALLEKAVPGRWIAAASGGVLVVWGMSVLLCTV